MKTTLYFALILLIFLMLIFVPNSIAEESRPIVRLIYFVPSDRQARPDIETTFDASIKRTQKFFADEMARHGFGRKAFRFETHANGNAIVHQIDGKYNDAFYHADSFDRILDELDGQLDFANNIYVVAVEISSGVFNNGTVCGIGGDNKNGGHVLVSASGDCRNNVALIPHELGHAFGLQHYFFNSANIMSYGSVREDLSSKQLSLCNAQWLNVHPYFNSDKVITRNLNTSIHPLSAGYDVKPPHAFRLRFELYDPDGLHQAQLIASKSAALNASSEPEFIDCQAFRGVSGHAEFATTRILDYVMIQVIDKEGNYTRKTFKVDATVPPPETNAASIPDPNLASAIQQALAIQPEKQITTFDMARLRSLTAVNRGITDLTGLEHAVRIESLDLTNNQIQDLTQVSKLTQLTDLRMAGNQIRDITPLANLTQLEVLLLAGNYIRDITSLANLTQLTVLELSGGHIEIDPISEDVRPARGFNEIRDITSLANLTQLKKLFFFGSYVLEDITPLANLTQLQNLELSYNQIRDVTPLKNLINLEILGLQHNQISDLSPLKRLIGLWQLYLDGNPLIDDITALEGMTQIGKLQLPSPMITDITPLSRLTQLVELDIRDNQIRDITPLADLRQLQALTMSGNPISDITPLSELTQLVELGLWGCHIRDIRPIRTLTRLERLNFSYNQISNIRPLSGLSKLRHLSFVDNRVSDVYPLMGLVNLKMLWTWGNPIEDREPLLTLLRRNPDIAIYHRKNGEPLPVSLSSFKVEHTDTGVVLQWITESEVDNAGFYIYRSQSKDGDFTVVNPKMIQGAGTTAERNAYTWTDTTAKPNTFYYYRIEDISYAGERQQLATVRLRGFVSATGKLITGWSQLKKK